MLQLFKRTKTSEEWAMGQTYVVNAGKQAANAVSRVGTVYDDNGAERVFFAEDWAYVGKAAPTTEYGPPAKVTLELTMEQAHALRAVIGNSSNFPGDVVAIRLGFRQQLKGREVTFCGTKQDIIDFSLLAPW